MFNSSLGKGASTKAWLFGIKKYFQIYNYFDELKKKMAIYHLTRKEDIWWQDIKKIKGIKERYLTWKIFKKHFK